MISSELLLMGLMFMVCCTVLCLCSDRLFGLLEDSYIAGNQFFAWCHCRTSRALCNRCLFRIIVAYTVS